MKSLTKKEKAVLAELRKNARISLTALSKKLGLPLTTTFGIVKRVQPVIKKHTALLNYEAFSFGILIFYFLRVKKEDRMALESFLFAHPFINTLARSDDGLSFFCEAIFKTNKQRHIFEEQLHDFSLVKREIHEIVEEITREQFLHSPDVLDNFFL